jgi:hypothetical protein
MKGQSAADMRPFSVHKPPQRGTSGSTRCLAYRSIWTSVPCVDHAGMAIYCDAIARENVRDMACPALAYFAE